MTPQSLLLFIPVLLSIFSSACSTPMCNNQCCRFVEAFPVRLKKLREDYSQIRDFYSPFACHAMNSILEFYLNTVLPTAMAGVNDDTRDLKPHMESIQQIFDELKSEVTRCEKHTRTFYGQKEHDGAVGVVIPSDSKEDSELEESQDEWIPLGPTGSRLRDS